MRNGTNGITMGAGLACVALLLLAAKAFVASPTKAYASGADLSASNVSAEAGGTASVGVAISGNAGQSRESVIDGFGQSARFGVVCGLYGLSA